MRKILDQNQNYVLRLEEDEELISTLKKFCKKEKIKAGFFFGLGAGKEAGLGFYDLGKKKYQVKKIKKPFEILNLVGNVSLLNKEIIIHAHLTLADQKFKIFGGHLNSLKVSATLEIFLIKFKSKIKRKYFKEIGLNLLEP